MPVAVFNYLFAQMYDNEPGEVASLVVISTLLAVVTTPIVLAVLLP
jgi:predicted permease